MQVILYNEVFTYSDEMMMRHYRLCKKMLCHADHTM